MFLKFDSAGTIKFLFIQILLGVFFAFAATPAPAQNQNAALTKAEKLIADQSYDEAIALLKATFGGSPRNARADLLLAQAYHWKKDLAEAKKWYKEAARLDPKYKLEILPLLDELAEWDEIIRLAKPEVATGKASVQTLAALWTAYAKVGNGPESDRILARIINLPESDYRSYILAENAILSHDPDKALVYLAQIKSKDLRAYAKTDPKFASLVGNPKFEELTR